MPTCLRVTAPTGTPHQPGLVRDTSKGKKVVSVAAGREHAVVATSDGRVWTFGGGNSVLGRTGSNAKPGLVGGALEGQFIRHVAAGEVRAALAQ
jgi:alpha-tubulin suppressor-like RCC1 family protein